MPELNTPAPDFSSVDQDNRPVQLSDFRGQYVVLYFYPKDDTPGCTIEANEFTALADEFAQANAIILGVSKDDCASHQAFIAKFNLNLVLLADTSGQICDLYGTWGEQEYKGNKYMGVNRATFVIDPTGLLVHAEYSVSAKGHARHILQKLQSGF